jgi:hypothetical protein
MGECYFRRTEQKSKQEMDERSGAYVAFNKIWDIRYNKAKKFKRP